MVCRVGVAPIELVYRAFVILGCVTHRGISTPAVFDVRQGIRIAIIDVRIRERIERADPSMVGLGRAHRLGGGGIKTKDGVEE